MMRGSVAGSTVAHVAVIVALFTVRHVRPEIIPGPEVVTVALIDPQSMSVPPVPQATSPPPVERVPDVAPNADEGVRITPPKPKTKPVPKPEQKAPEPRPVAPALPYAAVGPPGLSGQVSVDAADFEFTYYLMLVRNRIAQAWTPPTGVTGATGATTVVYFRIARNGSLSAVRVETSSGVDFCDRTALRAVLVSDPLPPLPLGFSGADLGVHFGFQYTGQ